MAVISNATPAWSDPVEVTEDEIWQPQGNSFRITSEGAPGEKDGVLLESGQPLPITGGKVVRYKVVGDPDTGYLVREKL